MPPVSGTTPGFPENLVLWLNSVALMNIDVKGGVYGVCWVDVWGGASWVVRRSIQGGGASSVDFRGGAVFATCVDIGTSVRWCVVGCGLEGFIRIDIAFKVIVAFTI